LPPELVEGAMRKRVGSRIGGACMRKGKIYTEAFEHQQRIRTRGILSAVTSPISLQSISQKHNLEMPLVYSTAEELCQSGRLPGYLSGHKDRAQYIPHVFAQNQTSAVKDFFTENGWIDYARFQQLDLPDPRKYMKQNFPGVVLLNSICVGATTLDLLDAAVEEAIAEGSWTDLSSMVPPGCTDQDVAILIQQCQSLKTSKCIVAKQSVVISEKMVSEAKERFMKWLPDELAKSKASKGSSSSAASEGASKQTGSEATAEETSAKGKDKKGKKKGRKGDISDDEEPVAAPVADDSDDEGGRGKKGKKGQKAKKGAKKEPAKPKKGGGTKEDRDSVVTSGRMAACMKEWYPQEEQEPLDGIISELRSVLQAEERKLQESIFVGSALSRKKRQEAYAAMFQDTYVQVQLYKHGFEALPEGVDQALLQKQMLREVCVKLATEAVCDAAYHAGTEVSDDAKQKMGTEDRRALLKSIPGDIQEPLSALEASLSKDAETFLQAADQLAEATGMYIKVLDKKAERTRVHQMTKQLEQELQLQEDGWFGAATTISLLYARATKTIIFCNESHKIVVAMESALDKMGEQIPRPAMIALRDLLEKLEEGLQVKSLLLGNVLHTESGESVDEALAKLKLEIGERLVAVKVALV